MGGMDSRPRFGTDDRVRILRRACCHRRLDPTMDVLVSLLAFFLYIVYELLVGLAAATASEADPVIAAKIDGPGYDRDQLVHIPNCVLVPNARLLGSEGRGIYSDGILRVGHHFQVWSRLSDLPNLLRQVQQAKPL